MEQTTTQDTGADARTVNEQALAAAREEAVQVERERVSEIQSLSATAIKYGIDSTVISEFIAKGVPIDQVRKELFAHLAKKGQEGLPPRAGVKNPDFPIRGEGGASVTRDGVEQRLACMQMALLLGTPARCRSYTSRRLCPIRNLQNGVWTPMFARTGERSSHSRRKRADQAQDVCVAQRLAHLPGGDVRMHPAVSGP
jgi:hypothetical protein